MLSPVIDSTLGQRCSSIFGYQFSEIVRSLMSVYFCGGSCVEDVTSQLMRHLSLHPSLRTCSSDTVLRAISELATGNTTYTSDTGKSYEFNTATKLNSLLVKALLSTGQLVAGASYDLDFDHQFIETEKYDAKMTYKKFTGYSPGVAVIGDLIVGIENRDGNANVRFHQQDTLERIFSNLESNDIHIKRARMDCGSCSREIVETVEKHSEHFYIRANRCGSLYDSLLALRGWKRKEINGIEYEVNSILTEKWEDKTYRLVIQRVRRMGSDPRRIQYAGANTDGLSVNYKAKYAAQQQVIKDNYKTFDVPYNGTDNDNYADGEGFCCNDGSMEAAVAQARKAQAHAVAKSFKDPDNYENLQFFYHPDHLGSSSFITNLEGEVVQHIEYVPFGEVFIEERNSVWNTPYLFNAKEFDEETGMYYYGARYYEPRLSLWMSTDPMEEKYPDYSTYIYAAQNPIAYSDPTGMEIRGVTKSDAEEFKSDVHLILGDSKFDNLRSLISLKGKKFQQIPDAALADALDGVTCSEDEMAYISLLVNTINSKEVHSIEYLKDGEEVSSSGYSDINKYLNSIDPDSKIGDAFRKREERSDGSTRYYYDDATIQTLGGEGFNVPTSKGSHSFIRGVQDKLKAVTSAHELLGHGLPSARKESPVHNNTNAIRTDNLVRRLLRLPQRDGSDHAGGKDIVSPYSLPYTK